MSEKSPRWPAISGLSMTKAKQIEFLTTQLNKLSADLSETKALLSQVSAEGRAACRLAEERAHHIALFKQDVLRLTIANAELRGYAQRTLEDDAVREAGPTMEVLSMPRCDTIGINVPDVYSPQLRRQGPNGLRHPGPFDVNGCGSPSRSDPLAQRSWMDRS